MNGQWLLLLQEEGVGNEVRVSDIIGTRNLRFLDTSTTFIFLVIYENVSKEL